MTLAVLLLVLAFLLFLIAAANVGARFNLVAAGLASYMGYLLLTGGTFG